MTARQPVLAEAPAAYYRAVLTQKYADFTGRARRSEYWWFALLNAGVAFGILAAAPILGSVSGTLGAIGRILYFVYLIGVIVPGLAVSVRRLHDTGKSGWFLLFGLIPVVGGIILLIFLLLDTDPEPNMYGVAPKYPN